MMKYFKHVHNFGAMNFAGAIEKEIKMIFVRDISVTILCHGVNHISLLMNIIHVHVCLNMSLVS